MCMRWCNFVYVQVTKCTSVYLCAWHLGCGVVHEFVYMYCIVGCVVSLVCGGGEECVWCEVCVCVCVHMPQPLAFA